MDPLTMMLLSSGTQTALGAYQMIKSQSQLNKLKGTPMPSLLESGVMSPINQNIGLARQQFQMGLNPATRAIAEQNAASTAASQYRQATDMSGGQLSSAIGRLGAMGQYQTASNLAQMDVAERGRGRSALMQSNSVLASILQQDSQQRLNRRMQLEQNLGVAQQQGRQNIAGALGSLGQYAMYDAGYNKDKKPKDDSESTTPTGES